MTRKSVLIGILIFILSFAPAFAAETTFDTNVTNANLTTVLQGIALRSGKEIVINGHLDGTVTVHLVKRTAEETLDYLGKIFNFNCDITDNVITVSPSDIGTQTRTFKIQYADLDYVKNSLGLFIPLNKISVNTQDSTVTIDGTPALILKAQKELINLDLPPRQVFIKAKVVSISRSDAEELGFTYSTPTYSSTSTNGLSWAVSSNAETTFSKGTIIAQPSIATVNGKQAKLSMGQTIPVFSVNIASDGTQTTTVSYQDVGIYLETTPRINEDGTVTCMVKPTVKAIEQWQTSGSNKAPQISSREAQTTVRVKSGETIIIGGLLQDTEIKNLSSVPGISQIPIIGWLFKNRSNEKNKMEIFIFITPQIIDDLRKNPGDGANGAETNE